MPADQDVGRIRRDDEFQRPKSHHHVRHSGRTAPGGGKVAETALGLIRNARRQDRLILGRERRLLSKSPGLGLIVRRLRRQPDGKTHPLPRPIRILCVVGGLGALNHKRGSEGNRNRYRPAH